MRGKREIELGAEIMRRYQHPDDWIDGISTRRADLYGKRLLQVWELRSGWSSRKAEKNTAAIRAWGKSVDLHHHLSFHRTPNHVVYLAVPKYLWNEVLEKLNNL